ncbi:galactose-specific lectin nattectin-like [Ctenopharyngodon idella]|uniref:galactose-specific lectin nattectin-like n=1 Tax=Ctenopharyngodon idella TaxID=7959 RepID=UPI002231D45F|nr:galactose-specific lectin nattectin-like [Ctenopharyngodon idella]
MMAVWTVYLSLCFLVALNASEETHPVESKDCGECWLGWTAFGCKCFKYFSNQQTWAGAEKTCLDVNANLASVHFREEYVFLQNLVIYETQHTTRAWIGGHDAVEEGKWLWSDGTRMNFQIWSPGNPNNYAGTEHCLEMNYDDGNWNDDKCSEFKPFVCAY